MPRPAPLDLSRHPLEACSYCRKPLGTEPATIYVLQMGESSTFPLCLKCVFVYALRLAEGHAEALQILQGMLTETTKRDRKRARRNKP
jgi:hypothetical protein